MDHLILPKGLLDIAATAECRKETAGQGGWSKEH